MIDYSTSRQRSGLALVGVVIMLLSACSAQPPKPADPLIGKIYDADGHALHGPEQLYKQFSGARVIYLGETHDNPRHHQIQLDVLKALIQQGLRPALGFEFFSLEQSSFLLQYARGKSSKKHAKAVSLEQLREQLGWESRDRDWEFYSPLLKLAKQYRLPVFGADLPAGLSRRLTRVGLDGLTALESRLLYPSGFENADYRKMMYAQFTEAHCGWSQPDLLKRLYETWVARNDAMAMAIGDFLRERPGRPVVMILGSGHVAHNMAVYERVAHQFPDIRQLNLGMQPVARSPRPLADYLAPLTVNGTRFAPEHEFFWFTDRVSYADPCERFRKQLKKPS